MSRSSLRLLIVDDSEADTTLLVRGLSHSGYEPKYQRVDTAQAMEAALNNGSWDVVVSDYSMPHFNGLDALAVLRSSGQDIPFILVSGTIGEDLAVEAMKAGAHDYVMKGNLQRLSSAIQRELREVEVRRSAREAENWIKYIARYDQLTNLPNRNLLYERVDQMLLGKKPFGLMLMDLDRFKEINDTIGHRAGDSLLQNVARRLQGLFGKAHTVARLGGDEFAVLLAGIDGPSARAAAQDLLKAFEAPFPIGEIHLIVKTSIGIALFPDYGPDKDALMRYADIAMYWAKESGSGFAFYSAERDSYSTKRLALTADLHHAIGRNQLSLAYQPKLSLRQQEVTGVEILARWRHPEHGLIPPDQFIAWAELTGFIRVLTLWGLEAALRQSRSWREAGINLPVSVNLSARGLYDVRLPEHVKEAMEKYGVRAQELEFEITESAVMADAAHALEILAGLKQIGIALSIDDFGTGYSSLSYLKRLPVDAVKIDKSFVMNMINDDNDAEIVRCTINLAHGLGLKVIAEGVENQAVWDRLVKMGCDEAQGYYMSRPMPAADMTDWLRDSRWRKELAESDSTLLEIGGF